MTPEEAQRILDGLEYRFDENDYSVQGPLAVLKSGHAFCLEGAILAAYLIPQYPPEFIRFSATYMQEGREISFAHAVFYYQDKEGFSSVGWSRHDELKGRDMHYGSIEELAWDYVIRFQEHGAAVKEISTFNLDRIVPQGIWKELLSLTLHAKNIYRNRHVLELIF
ncbi:MAG: hypothetical protein NDI94_02735 [Candidatus Woesearchaeota archaeon]|nr:hypothetical protein [Candidatus Woesearchaeota archaeon]